LKQGLVSRSLSGSSIPRIWPPHDHSVYPFSVNLELIIKIRLSALLIDRLAGFISEFRKSLRKSGYRDEGANASIL